MDENDFKRLLEESAAETRSEFKHLIEETHRRLDANAAETLARFDQVDTRFDQIDVRLEKVDARFDQVDARADALKQHIDKIAVQMKLDFGLAVEAMRTDVQRVADGC